jgi:UDP-N-acetylglucosamine--N-acetylmuramyl-(pentapeptide) pyrophosphoryl-undecaprenol N-acetylglucosamine transferase
VFEFLWLGTKYGPEKQMVEQAGIKFKAITGGKWRRYFSLKNLFDIFKIKIAFWQSFFILLKWRPDLAISAGSFVSVPAVWAAWLLGAKVLVHQQDIRPGLANRLMTPLAKVVTATFEESLKIYGKKAVWIGNPTRRSLKIPNPKSQIPNINENLPIVLIVGGGTGAMAINKIVEENLGELIKFCQIIHVTGKDKGARASHPNSLLGKERGYYAYEFLDVERMAEALGLADAVVTRAGMSFLTELSYLGKPSIIIPLPDSHQEANAEFFKSKKAAIVIDQKSLTAASLTHMIKDLLSDEKMRGQLAINMGNAMKQGASQEIAKIIYKIIKRI